MDTEHYHQLELPLFPNEVSTLYETTNIHLFGIARMCNMTEMEVTAYIYDNYSSEYIAERNVRAQDYHYRRLQPSDNKILWGRVPPPLSQAQANA